MRDAPYDSVSGLYSVLIEPKTLFSQFDESQPALPLIKRPVGTVMRTVGLRSSDRQALSV
jgi:hypothetical protein